MVKSSFSLTAVSRSQRFMTIHPSQVTQTTFLSGLIIFADIALENHAHIVAKALSSNTVFGLYAG
jgi:hypothetical protein